MIKSNQFQELFEAQKANQYTIANSSAKERIKKLNKLKRAIEITYKEKIRKALYDDFKKPQLEVDLTEIYPVISEIKHTKRNLKSWMQKKRTSTPLSLIGASSWIEYQPKGVCLIISPWNFPVNLTFGPLVSAIAAGNTVIIKPSEMTPNISSVMKAVVEAVFETNEVTLVQGSVDVSQELLKLPFNHIFFTGSSAVGKIVMKAASKHLTSVTLELGGKSPTIIDETANLKQAAKRITWGKFLNSGQTCVAPDYLIIHESVKNEFVSELKKQIELFFSKNIQASDSYARIVNQKHFNRLKEHLEKSKNNNSTIEIGGKYNEADHYIPPTVLSNLKTDDYFMQNEIFGPILPMITYKDQEEVIEYINSKDRPLALYIYSKSKKTIDYIIKNTRAGGTCVNNNVLHYSNHYLPFGGSNNSGIGKAHGYFGFQEFSNKRSVMRQNFSGVLELVFPPYTSFKQKLVDLTLKWF